MKKNTLAVVAVCWMLIVTIFATAYITMQVMGPLADGGIPGWFGGALSASPDERTLAERYGRLEEVRQILSDEYYQPLSDDELVLGAIRGMLAAPSDPYTYYYTPDEMRESAEHMSGAYEGVGLVLGMDEDGMLVVLRVFPNAPAAAAGVQLGDRIIKINGTDVSAATSQDMGAAIALIKTAEDPSVTLTLRRADERIDVPVTRAAINAARTERRMLDDSIGYIAIYEFMGDDVSGFERALTDLTAQGMKALIIDVRNNPGGLLQDVVSICDILLPEGLIVYTEERSGERDEYFSDAEALDVPMAVLTNGMSASASEILAGALQDYGAATIVGETTFGKGIVQVSIPFRSDGAGMQLTIATYFTPSGRSIHGVGIEPDVGVKLADGIDPTQTGLHPERDAQLAKAMEILNNVLKNQ